jgi:hypothetical protein
MTASSLTGTGDGTAQAFADGTLVVQPAPENSPTGRAWRRVPFPAACHDVSVGFARTTLAAVTALIPLTACGDVTPAAGTYELSSSEAEEYPTAYVDAVVADPEGDDLAEGAGEHVVIANNATIRIDMGGWWLEVGDELLPLGIGRQIDVGRQLRVHPGPGETNDDAVFVGLAEEVLDDDGGVIVLRDAAGSEVATFRYGTAG